MSANWGQYSSDTFAPIDGVEGYGLAAAYDLGGGASVHVGYGNDTDCGTVAGCSLGSSWSFGVAMSF